MTMSQAFHCYEYLFLKRIDEDDELWDELIRNLVNNVQNDDPLRLSRSDPAEIRLTRIKDQSDGGNIWHVYVNGFPPDSWYITIALEKRGNRFIRFVKKELKQKSVHCISPRNLLGSYLNSHTFVALHLDSVFKYGDDIVLPRELFKCINVKTLSLRYNYLENIPADIGRMKKLEYLALTNNRLQNKSIPYTLTFCQKLRVLLLDFNLLDALPGFLLKIPMLRTVHRHGNHNYFKATFMWYHTDINDRILRVRGYSLHDVKRNPKEETLLFFAAKAVIASKVNFFTSPLLAEIVKDYISDIHSKFNICGNCKKASSQNVPGFKVFTFKNPYLGNTCVPFQHWACSEECAEAIEVPARFEQMVSAMEQDRQYDNYVKESQVKCNRCKNRDSYNLGLECQIL